MTAQRAQVLDGDEYVVEAILTFGKVSTLVRTLLALEAWRTFVLCPRRNDNVNDGTSETGGCGDSTLLPLLAKNGNSMRCAFILHAETTLVSLLNLILYRRESCEEMDGETAVALVDYCARQMVSSVGIELISIIASVLYYTSFSSGTRRKSKNRFPAESIRHIHIVASTTNRFLHAAPSALNKLISLFLLRADISCNAHGHKRNGSSSKKRRNRNRTNSKDTK